MNDPDPEPTDLVRALQAIGRSQSRLIRDIKEVCAGDPRFLDAFRRWREWLTLLKLQLIRAEGRLLHYLMVPEDRRPWKEYPIRSKSLQSSYHEWDQIIPPYLQALHIDTRYLRIPDLRELEHEAVIALAATDLVAVSSVMEVSQFALEQYSFDQHTPWLEDMAFYHILAPWKVQGLRPLADFLRWMESFLGEMDEL